MRSVMRRSSGVLRLLGMCFIGQALAFVIPSSGRGGSFAYQAQRHRERSVSPIAMSGSPAESAVARYKKYVGSKRWNDLDRAEEQATGVFQEICNVYGEENAVEMVKASPSCLGYDASTFRATFEAFSEVFPPEDTKGMVTRNPNLLAVRPTGFGGACNAKSDTMTMSYIIAYTRPIGPVLLASLFLLLSIPFIELATGIPRQEFLSVLASKAGG